METTATRTEIQPHYAGFGIRFAANFLDTGFLIVWGIIMNQVATGTNVAIVAPLATIIGQVAGLTYLVGLPALFGWTPGKWLVGLRIISADSESGGIGWRTAILRWIGTYISSLALGLGYLAVIIDPEKRTWHDRIAGTHVLDARSRHAVILDGNRSKISHEDDTNHTSPAWLVPVWAELTIITVIVGGIMLGAYAFMLAR